VAGLTFSADGTRVLSASADQSVRIWDADALSETAFLKGHTSEIWSIALSPDGRRAATGGKDHLVKIWDARFRERATGSKVFPEFRRVVFSRDLSTVLTVDEERRWKIRDSETLGAIGEIALPSSAAIRGDESIDLAGNFLAIRQTNGTVQIWSSPAGRLVKVLPVADSTGGPILSRDGERMAFTSANRRVIHVVALPDGEQIASLEIDRPQWPLALSPDGDRLIAGLPDNDDLIIWEVQASRSSTYAMSLSGENQTVTFSADGKMLAAVGGAGFVNLFDVTDSGLAPRWRVNADLMGLFAACFSPKGDRLAVVSGAGVIWLCDTATGQELGTLKVAKAMWSRSMFSPSGNNLLVYADNRLHLYQALARSEIATIGEKP
jgi:WD40 repeat protein